MTVVYNEFDKWLKYVESESVGLIDSNDHWIFRFGAFMGKSDRSGVDGDVI